MTDDIFHQSRLKFKTMQAYFISVSVSNHFAFIGTIVVSCLAVNRSHVQKVLRLERRPTSQVDTPAIMRVHGTHRWKSMQLFNVVCEFLVVVQMSAVVYNVARGF